MFLPRPNFHDSLPLSNFSVNTYQQHTAPLTKFEGAWRRKDCGVTGGHHRVNCGPETAPSQRKALDQKGPYIVPEGRLLGQSGSFSQVTSIHSTLLLSYQMFGYLSSPESNLLEDRAHLLITVFPAPGVVGLEYTFV